MTLTGKAAETYQMLHHNSDMRRWSPQVHPFIHPESAVAWLVVCTAPGLSCLRRPIPGGSRRNGPIPCVYCKPPVQSCQNAEFYDCGRLFDTYHAADPGAAHRADDASLGWRYRGQGEHCPDSGTGEAHLVSEGEMLGFEITVEVGIEAGLWRSM